MNISKLIEIIEQQCEIANNLERELIELCNGIVEASTYWTGSDEEKNPELKRIRTIAGHYLNRE
jgi:hypothetical protein